MNDTYIVQKSKSVFTVKNMLIVALILIVIWLLTCNKSKEPVQPKVTIPELVKTNTDNNAEAQRIRDSSAKVIAQLEIEKKASDDKLIEFIEDYGNNEVSIDNTLAQPVPDTCKKIVGELTDKFNKLKVSSTKKDNEFRRNISVLNKINQTQKNQLKQDSIDAAKQQLNFLDCIETAKTYKSNAEKNKPKNEINGGISGMGNYAGNLNPAIGGVIGWRGKKGLDISVAVYTNNVATITAKKTIFKF